MNKGRGFVWTCVRQGLASLDPLSLAKVLRSESRLARAVLRKSYVLFCFAQFGFMLPAVADELQVAVTANVSPVFADLSLAFKHATGHTLKASVGSSGKLTAQIENGAPYDVFLSADLEYPRRLQEKSYAVGELRVYAYGVLVWWTCRDIDLSQWQRQVREQRWAKIAIANPKLAPFGRAAVHLLEHFHLFEKAQPNLIYGESIAQVNQAIFSGAVDAGLTAKAVVVAPEMAGKGHWLELSQDAYQALPQVAVVLKHGQKNVPLASAAFLNFLATADAQAILKKYGYRLP